MGNIRINDESFNILITERCFCNERYITSMLIGIKEGDLIESKRFSLLRETYHMEKSRNNCIHGINPTTSK
jgi:hypothetical protein